MQFFTLFRRNDLRTSWEFSTQGVLWRLHPAPGSRFVGEERDLASRTAMFFCLDAVTGAVQWHGQKYGDGWWTGVSGIFRGVILLHGFAAPDLPEEKKIIAVDLSSGRELWRNEAFTFRGVKNGVVIASRQTQRGGEIVQISLTGGTIDGVVAPGEARELLQVPDDDERGSNDIVHPNRIEPSDRNAFPMAVLLRRAVPELADDGPLEYIEQGNAGVFGYAVTEHHAGPGESTFTSFLAVIEKATGRVIYRATLDRGIPFPPQGSFMMREGILYCIRNRRTITAVAMQPSRRAPSTTPSMSR